MWIGVPHLLWITSIMGRIWRYIQYFQKNLKNPTLSLLEMSAILWQESKGRERWNHDIIGTVAEYVL